VGPPAEVSLQATITASAAGVRAASTVSSVVVQVTGSENTMELPAGVKVTLDRPVSADVDLTSLLVQDSPTQVHLGSFSATETGVYQVKIHGPGGGVILHNDTSPASELMLGTIGFGFQRLATGVIVAPATATVTLPTRGTTLNDSATFTGLAPGNVVTTQLLTNTLTSVTRHDTVAPGHTSVTITDVAGGISASIINGPNSVLSAVTTAP
jgi:hypothetical protein